MAVRFGILHCFPNVAICVLPPDVATLFCVKRSGPYRPVTGLGWMKENYGGRLLSTRKRKSYAHRIHPRRELRKVVSLAKNPHRYPHGVWFMWDIPFQGHSLPYFPWA